MPIRDLAAAWDTTRSIAFFIEEEEESCKERCRLYRFPRDSQSGQGGFGLGGSIVLEERLDVTGHVISALSKLSQINKDF